MLPWCVEGRHLACFFWGKWGICAWNFDVTKWKSWENGSGKANDGLSHSCVLPPSQKEARKYQDSKANSKLKLKNKSLQAIINLQTWYHVNELGNKRDGRVIWDGEWAPICLSYQSIGKDQTFDGDFGVFLGNECLSSERNLQRTCKRFSQISESTRH